MKRDPVDYETAWRRMFRTWRLRKKATEGDVWRVYERGKSQVQLVVDRLGLDEARYAEGVKASRHGLGSEDHDA